MIVQHRILGGDLEQAAELQQHLPQQQLQQPSPQTVVDSSTLQSSSVSDASTKTQIDNSRKCDCGGYNNSEDESRHKQSSFKAIALKHGTDKVEGHEQLPLCLKNPKVCVRGGCVNPRCRPWGHFYDTMYQSRLGHLSATATARQRGSNARADTRNEKGGGEREPDPFQVLEIGFHHGHGFETLTEFFPNHTEIHSMEISCMERGPRREGKWPHDNYAALNKDLYPRLVHEDRLHCGDASRVDYLHRVWTESMNRPDAPPLRVVVDDGSHRAEHMVQTVFFWFPRIAPGGLLVMEDIQPIPVANLFRTQFLPQLLSDLHYCGDPKLPDAPCFPTIQPLLASIHCEMHICVLERNNETVRQEPTLAQSKTPEGALDLRTCKSFQPNQQQEQPKVQSPG